MKQKSILQQQPKGLKIVWFLDATHIPPRRLSKRLWDVKMITKATTILLQKISYEKNMIIPLHSSETSSSLKPHLVPVSRSYTGSFVLRLFVMSAMFCKWSREGCLVPVKITQRLIGYLLLIPQIKSYLWEQRQIKGTKVIMLEIFDLLRLEVTFKGNHFTANYICHFMSQASLTRPTRTAFSESIVTNI